VAATSGTATALLDVRDVTKRFPMVPLPVLDHVDLAMREGEFVSLIGPSGCGKTTLLRIVAGLLRPSHGEVALDGHPSMEPSREKAVVFQHFNLFPWRTATDNVAYGLELQGIGKRERAERARRYLRTMGLEGFEDHYPGQMSGGMKQRVGIARALVVEPRLLLMDEPFGALDALTREYLQGELERLCRDNRLTTLFVTHSLDEALFLSDRVVVMGSRPGRIVEEFEIPFERPRTASDFRSDPAYATIRGRIWELLRGELARIDADGPAGAQGAGGAADDGAGEAAG
jgi:NitT/TauT family transport system ATP-binding protein